MHEIALARALSLTLVDPLHLPLTPFHNRSTLQTNIVSSNSPARVFTLESAARPIGQHDTWDRLDPSVFELGLKPSKNGSSQGGKAFSRRCDAVNNAQCGNLFRRPEISSRTGTPFTWVRL